ncbi:MAG TPA: preprotein translocase subunit SecG [Acetomicrobium flavidum]|uniref:Protein-export membrane protein SecG n=1 Tax=Acetomicrobium mobile (strain ATCC BAA-54 / DSM 13181 / JCM 12221 / NGA) TaxID=891968 RepID=I4BYE8_ACEMN|nr:preprotein translocase subunit SecG [Acetomicrobium mobile]NLG95178.1 preprotein translocase subunit SecG [Acetomicrobium flavidum]AFM22305.1 protein translocase, SecG subunit [Acetomicrobium mobile DSM 13181]HOJ82741.1 preprotein translocase subunit SecG [Acetomicrobium flavidum]HOM31893.1 preprotein translocase subunit SecG [Acetomicrobium flavidum]HOP87691.1 preprotein translocase subunit SecG [Acetomicrobium flavidum]
MFVVIACLHLLVSVALIGVIMLQRRKQSGFAGVFGGGTQADMSSGQWQRLSGLSKVTVLLLSLFMVTSLVLVLMSAR